jgi:MarR family transcriptional regulator, temperature-dependent positive regulator of motility
MFKVCYGGIMMSKPDAAVVLESVDKSEAVASSAPVSATIFEPNLSPSHLLHRAQQVAGDLHVAAFGSGGLTQRQVAVLAVLGAGDGISQTDLVTKTGIDRSTLAEMVARMETKGLMIRTKSSTDSRANCVSLTDSGREALQDALPKLDAIDKGVLTLLPAGRRGTFVELLTRIALPETAKGEAKASAGAKKAKKKDKKKKDKKKKADKG